MRWWRWGGYDLMVVTFQSQGSHTLIHALLYCRFLSKSDRNWRIEHLSVWKKRFRSQFTEVIKWEVGSFAHKFTHNLTPFCNHCSCLLKALSIVFNWINLKFAPLATALSARSTIWTEFAVLKVADWSSLIATTTCALVPISNIRMSCR